MLSVEAVLAQVLSGAEPLAAEDVAVEVAAGRVTARALKARLTQPPFAASAMDGYAARVADLATLPRHLKVIGTAAAGHPFSGRVGPGEAVRIFTGAPVPEGADTIVIQENTRAGDGAVEVREGRPDPEHIRARGIDFAEGDALIATGRRLGANSASLAAAMGHALISVRRAPKVRILVTGDEIALPAEAAPRLGREGLAPGEIVASNHVGLLTVAARAGADARLLGRARDTRESLARFIDVALAEPADVLVTIGGASVGDHDLVAPALQAAGFDLAFQKIAMRPGKPMMLGRRGSVRALGLPGNPVSAILCARLFLVPLIEALQGLPAGLPPTRPARLAVALPRNGPRRHFMRAVCDFAATPPVVTPLTKQDSSLLSVLARANALLVQPENAPPTPAGAEVAVLPLED